MNSMLAPPALTTQEMEGRGKIKIELLFGDANNATIYAIYAHAGNALLEDLDQPRALSPEDPARRAAILLTDLVPPANLGERYRYWRRRCALPAAIVISVGNTRPGRFLGLLFGASNIRNYPLTAEGITRLRLDTPLILKTARDVSRMPATHLSHTTSAVALGAAIGKSID